MSIPSWNSNEVNTKLTESVYKYFINLEKLPSNLNIKSDLISNGKKEVLFQKRHYWLKYWKTKKVLYSISKYDNNNEEVKDNIFK